MKKQILTFAVLATIAVGAAVAGNSKTEFNAKPIGDPGDCVIDQPCVASNSNTCEILDVTYTGDDGIHTCTTPMERLKN